MPEKDERDLWWAYLAGKPETDWNLSKKAKRLNQTLKRTQEAHGMRAWGDESSQNVSYGGTSDSWYATGEDQGNISTTDPTDSLSDLSTQFAVAEDNSSTKFSEIFVKPSSSTFYVPREPSPVVIRGINEVS